MNTTRLRPVVVTLAAVALAAALSGCAKNDEAAAGPGAGKPSTSTSSPSPSAASDGSDGSGGSASKAPAEDTADDAADKASSPTAPATKAPAPKKADCADGPPTPDEVDPDEIALYRTEEIEGDGAHLNLILQHGAWGCPGKDTDGPPFVTTGEESRWALDQAAYVSATTPITDTTENQRIGVQELVDWIAAHPDSGLVFKYQTGDDGAIHRLDQVFTP